ncbi:MAG TPA: NAD(+) synthase, partial [Actinomycetales bacterium]|nr:NAD(+) synthase [Actinomycetales bacterium]
QGDVALEEPQIAQTYRAITLAIADYVAKNGFHSVVLGLSGGIDSALAAAIAADALGGPQVTGIAMPSPYSSAHSLADAGDLAKRIRADYREIPIGGVMEAFTAAMEMPGVAGENLQARIRGTLLMGVSNIEGQLVLAPGNKTELAVGYSTIYGDAVGGFGPLKDVYKTQIWALSRWRNNLALDRGEIPPIPESSITKPPSAELRPDQFDQDSLPEYAILDPLLEEHLERRAGRAELLAAGYPANIVDWTLRAVRGAEWKRRQYPVGPKVTARSFDAGRRVPITNNFRDTEDDHV